MKHSEIAKKVEHGKDRWLVWVGYILDETDEKRELEYFGKFAKTKHSAIGAAKLLLNNTNPYRIIIQDTEPFKQDPSLLQSELTDFFKLEAE